MASSHVSLFRVLGFRVERLGFRIEVLGFRARVWDLDFGQVCADVHGLLLKLRRSPENGSVKGAVLVNLCRLWIYQPRHSPSTSSKHQPYTGLLLRNLE